MHDGLRTEDLVGESIGGVFSIALPDHLLSSSPYRECCLLQTSFLTAQLPLRMPWLLLARILVKTNNARMLDKLVEKEIWIKKK